MPTQTPLTHVILGDGVAGMSAAQVIRSKRPQDSIVVVSSDPQAFYFRAALTNYIAGALGDHELWGMPPNHWQELKIKRVLGDVTAIDCKAQIVKLRLGQSLRYDRLLIATGCRPRPWLPTSATAAADRVGLASHIQLLRSLGDARRILSRLGKAKRALVVGGGILGLELCHGMLARNVVPTLVHRGEWLLEKLLDKRGGELVERRMQRDGVEVFTNTEVSKLGFSGDTLNEATLSSGDKVPVDLLIACTGNLPNSEFLRSTDVVLEKGYISVDREMRVNGVKNIWAAGDVCHFVDRELPFPNPTGLWQPARQQGQIAGLVMSSFDSISTVQYRPGVLYNATKAWDLDIATLGHHIDAPGESVVADYHQQNRPIYKRLLIRGDRVVGAMLLGDRREGHALKHLMNLKGLAADISSIRNKILDPSFDLTAWVATRANQTNVERWRQTVPIHVGALPPSLAAQAGLTSQWKLADGDLPSLMDELTSCPTLGLRIDGDLVEFQQTTIKVSALPEADYRVDDHTIDDEVLTFSLEGTRWALSSNRKRNSKILVNRKAIHGQTFLHAGDNIKFGRFFAICEVQYVSDKPQTPEIVALLSIKDKRYPLHVGVNTLGSSSENDITIGHPSVASFHAQLAISQNPLEIVLSDSGSETGTFIAEQRLVHPTKIEIDAVFRLGTATATLLRYESSSASSNQAKKSSASKRSGAAAVLISDNDDRAGKSYRIQLPAVIGRSAEADLQIDDALLSRKHVLLEQGLEGFQITDLASANGVAVDNRLLIANVPTPCPAECLLRIGRQTFILKRAGDNESILSDSQFMESKFEKVERSSLPAELAETQDRVFAVVGNWNREFFLTRDRAGIGRDPKNEVHLAGKSVSRRHCQLERHRDGWLITDLHSTCGTKINDELIPPDTPRLIKDRDKLQIGDYTCVLRLAPNRNSKAPFSGPVGESGIHPVEAFKLDLTESEQILGKSLRHIVQAELEACIGCHECMRACPLPQAASVSIGALNSYGASSGPTSQLTLKFVEDCTQCQACVPVCPVDIHRSRIVLWNKLKAVPDATRRISIQLANGTVRTGPALAQVCKPFAAHPILGLLHETERLRLFSEGRYRALTNDEFLLEEGKYLDAVWFLLEGSLAIGMATANNPFAQMVSLSPGQCVGEGALLTDQPCDVSARSIGHALVVGFSKYSIQFACKQNKKFKSAFERLYIARSAEVFLRKIPSLSELTDAEITRLVDAFEAERYTPGCEVMTATEALECVALVKRGFIKEIRERNGHEVVTDYLGQGDAFGILRKPEAQRGRLVRYEAGTVAEVITMSTQQVRVLKAEIPGLSRWLVYNSGNVPQAGRTEMINTAAEKGILQATQLLVIDSRACVDCNNCVDACERRHGAARLDRSGSGVQLGPYLVPASCYHCDDPVCLLCSVNGIVREPSGEISIIEDNCIGCAGCAERCPYDNIQMVPREKNQGLLRQLIPTKIARYLGLAPDIESLPPHETLAVKCDLCGEHQDGPACVRSCPTGAAMRVDPLALFLNK